MLFQTDAALQSVLMITPALLKKLGIRGLVLDVDNTLTTHNNPVPAEDVPQWIETMKANGIRLIIVSNNTDKRVKDFAQLLDLPYVASGAKPLPQGIRKAVKLLKLCPRHTAVVGDQLFTDVLGARLAGTKMIYVSPISKEESAFFKLKRMAERPFLPHID